MAVFFDIDDLVRNSAHLSKHAAELIGIEQKVNHILANVTWTDPHARIAQSDWADHALALMRAAQFLQDTSQLMSQIAARYTDADSAEH